MSSHYVTGKNGIDHLAKSLVHSRKGTTQITATQSVDTDDETLAVLSVSCDWQIKTAGDAPLTLPETIDARGTRLPASACRIINMQLAKTPKRFALWQGADNLQNLRFPDLGIPCPFMPTPHFFPAPKGPQKNGDVPVSN